MAWAEGAGGARDCVVMGAWPGLQVGLECSLVREQHGRRGSAPPNSRAQMDTAALPLETKCSGETALPDATKSLIVGIPGVRLARAAMALSKLSGDEQRILFTQLCNVLELY